MATSPIKHSREWKPFWMDFSIPGFPIAHLGCFPPSSLLSAALLLGTSPAFPLIALQAPSFLLYCVFVSGALSLAAAPCLQSCSQCGGSYGGDAQRWNNVDAGSWAIKFKVHSRPRISRKAINGAMLALCMVCVLVSNERYLYPTV